MTIKEANDLLDGAPISAKPSRVNPYMTEADAVDIVRKGLNSGLRVLEPDGVTLIPLYAKRVMQVSKNQKCPRCGT